MWVYLTQRFIIFIFVCSLSIGISGLWIPGFYTVHYDNVKIIKNIECCHNQVHSGTTDKSLGRYVKFEYKDKNGIKRTDDEFWEYNNTIDHSCSKSYYTLINKHEYNGTKGWLIGLIVALAGISGILLIPACIGEMDVKTDYYGNEEKDIGFLRLNIFYYWKIFLGYPIVEVKEYCENLANEINNTSIYNYKIKYYSEMNNELNQYIKEKKQ